MMMKIKQYFPWLAPALLILFLAPFSTELDLAIARYFYVDGHFQSNPLVNFIYSYGFVPGWIITGIAFFTLILSFFLPEWKKWRYYTLLPLLTVIVGAGLIVHFALKDHWGRPRPKQVTEFGGIQPFRPFYKPNFFHQPEPSKSFPSGHCSMGFLFLSIILVGYRSKHHWLFWFGILSTMILGGILGYTRIAQGGHFFTDVIFTAVVMWWTALFFDWLIFNKWMTSYEAFNQKAI